MDGGDPVEGRSTAGKDDDAVLLREGPRQLGDVSLRSAAAFRRECVRDQGYAQLGA